MLPVDAAAAPSKKGGIPHIKTRKAEAMHASLAVAAEEADKVLW